MAKLPASSNTTYNDDRMSWLTWEPSSMALAHHLALADIPPGNESDALHTVCNKSFRLQQRCRRACLNKVLLQCFDLTNKQGLTGYGR
jgi:hypothetical protein